MNRDGNRCVFCGIAAPLEIANITGFSRASTFQIDDFITLCANCHRRLDTGSVRGFEFESFINDLLQATPEFSSIQRDSKLNDSKFAYDLSAARGGEKLVFECRSEFAFVNSRFNALLDQLEEYAKHSQGARMILVTLAELTDEQKRIIATRGLKHWGPKYIAENFTEQLGGMRGNFIADLINFTAGNKTHTSQLSEYRQQLAALKPGKSDWSSYQKLVGNILDALYVPPLEKTIIECSDEFKVNRRDFVLPNYCNSGFWHFLREQYSADYVVVDAKNYTNQIKKKEILQIANYLKKHGTGLFGMIFSRVGPAASARVTMREQWAVYGKLIVVFTDDDVLAMLSAASSGGNADTVIRQRIEEFRLKM